MHPEAQLSIFVDDLSGQVQEDTEQQAIEAFEHLMADTEQAFQELGLPFADEKACILSNHPRVADEVVAKMGLMPHISVEQARSLGYDFTLTRRRAKKVQRAKLKEVQHRSAKLRIITKCKRPAPRIFKGVSAQLPSWPRT